MRTTFIIALITLHLFGNTELGQLLKLPKLISHYFQHKKSNPSVTFIQFLAMHYGGDDGTSADDSTDKQLPYHQVDYHCLFGTYFPLEQYNYSVRQIDYVSEYGSELVSGNPSKHVSLILQPPRII